MDLIDSSVLGAARILIPGLLCDMDRSMEETLMKFAKESGTFVSCFGNDLFPLMFYKFKYLIRHPRFALHLSHNIISNSHEIKFNISLTKENYA